MEMYDSLTFVSHSVEWYYLFKVRSILYLVLAVSSGLWCLASMT